MQYLEEKGLKADDEALDAIDVILSKISKRIPLPAAPLPVADDGDELDNAEISILPAASRTIFDPVKHAHGFSEGC